MELRIFDVEHGQCALLTSDNGQRMMVDCGHSRNWNPGDYLRRTGVSVLDILTVTNYDEDHVSGLPGLLRSASVSWIQSNPGVDPHTIKQLKTEDGVMGAGIDALIHMKTVTHASAPTVQSPFLTFPNVEMETFWLSYPKFEDENNLSLVTFLKVHGIGFLFPGDMEKAGWEALFAQSQRLRNLMPQVCVLIASHHGRRNGIYEPMFDLYGCNPYWVVISDKKHMHETQQTVPYYMSKAKGARFRHSDRWVLTTRNDGDITFDVRAGIWSAS